MKSAHYDYTNESQNQNGLSEETPAKGRRFRTSPATALLTMILLGFSCSKAFPEGELFNQWIMFRMIPLPAPTVVLSADADRHYSEFQGTVTITPSDEEWIDSYEVYWGGANANLQLYTEVAATGAAITITIPANTVMPAGTDSIRIFSKNTLGNTSAVAATATMTDLRQHYIFITAYTQTGGDFSVGAHSSPILNADDICNVDTFPWVGKDATKSYKAILVDGSNRRACSSTNCSTGGSANHKDWVLKENTQYIRPSDSLLIFTTNENSIFPFTQNADRNFDGSANRFWTGLNADWTSSTLNCVNWTSSQGLPTPDFGDYGLGNKTNSEAISEVFDTGQQCDQALVHLLCAEQ